MDERRVVTVLFADLVGYTSLSETRDPERVKNIVDQCFRRLADDVTTYGGQVDKIVGDALLALFGAPIAHEDDAERAVRAALDMQSTLASVRGDLGASLTLRIGVNTGEVLVGALSAGGDYTAMGDVVNVASRLQTMAEPGEILVGRATYAGTEGTIRYRHRGLLRARGREETVEAWSAIEPLARPGIRPRRERAPLVGREPELGLLRHAATSATRRNRAQLVLVVGEPGVGKSRLVEELAAWAATDLGATVLEGRCPPYGEAKGWWPLNEALRGLLGASSDDDPATLLPASREAVATATGLAADGREVDRVVAGLAYLMGDDSALRDVDPSRVDDEARVALSTFLDGLGRRGPVLLVLHGLQWADPVVTVLLDHLLGRPRRLPLVVAATARPDIEATWRPRPGPYDLLNVHIDPLDPVATRELLASVAGDMAPTVRELLVDRSGGNPLYLQEMLALIDADPAVSPAELPATLRGLVSARIDALEPDERAVLEDASVIGRNGTLDALDALGRARGSSDIGSLTEALAARDQLDVDGRSWSFQSDFTREVAYETLTKAGRALRHFRIGSWLAERAASSGRSDEQVGAVARHLGQAAELVAEVGAVDGIPPDLPERALEQLQSATDRAARLGQQSEVVRLVGRALAVAPDTALANRRRLLLERAQALAWLRNPGAARVDVDRALDISPADDRDEALGLLALGSVEVAEGRHGESTATLEDALRRWREIGDEERAAESLSQLGMSYFLGGEIEKADEALSEVVGISRELGLRRTEAWALWNLASIAFASGNPLESERRIEEARTAFTAAGDSGGLDWATGLLGFVRFFQGRRAEANAIVEEILADSKSHEDSWGLAMMLLLLASLRLWDGRTSEAIAPASEARRLFQRLGNVEGELRVMFLLATALVADGQVRIGMEMVDEARAMADVAGDARSQLIGRQLGVESALGILRTQLHAGCAGMAAATVESTTRADLLAAHDAALFATSEWLSLAGLAHLQAGSVEEAVTMLTEAVGTAVSDGPRAHAIASLSLALVAGGRLAEARSRSEEALAIAEATYLDRALAILASGFGRFSSDAGEAMEQLEKAVSLADGTGDRILQAVARLALGHLGSTARNPDAAAMLEAARRRLRELGTEAPGWDTALARAASGAVAGAQGAATDRRR